MSVMRVSRRHVMQSLGVVLATFALPSLPVFGQAPANVPLSLRNNRKLEGWIRLEADETVTVFTGKAELGQGILTALAQIAAEELDAGFEKIRMVSADTSRGPDEQYTFGSQSVEQSGGAIRAAGAEARGLLLAAAARRFGISAEELQVRNGTIVAADGRRATFWELANEGVGLLKGDIALAAAPKKPGDYSIVGKSVNRIDLPGKLTGAPSYVQDMRLPGMVFARVVRPPRYGARLIAFDEAAVRARPGVVAVVSDGNFLAVAAMREEQVIAARERLPRTRVGAMTRSSFLTWPVCAPSCRSCARRPSSWAAPVSRSRCRARPKGSVPNTPVRTSPMPRSAHPAPSPG
jgi:nicotinate dehydrogenase subunit B